MNHLVNTTRRLLCASLGAAALNLVAFGHAGAEGQTAPLPDPVRDIAAPAANAAVPQSAVFAGGCFWGVEAVFKHVKGVLSSTSGYAGGAANTADYEIVSGGRSGHAESVKVVFDPTQISYGQLLKVFFSVAHDPTQLNRQGPDHGTQYRSAIFTTGAEQKSVAEAYIAQLENAKVFRRPIVTQVTPLPEFFAAEAYHQDYLARHPTQPYIVFNDLPKLQNLKATFPNLYRS